MDSKETMHNYSVWMNKVKYPGQCFRCCLERRRKRKKEKKKSGRAGAQSENIKLRE